MNLRICRGCGCTDIGGCSWALIDFHYTAAGIAVDNTGVCSACAFECDFEVGSMAYMRSDRAREVAAELGVPIRGSR